MRKLKTRKQIVEETIAGLKEAAIAHQVNIELFEKLGEPDQNAKRKLELARGERMVEILEGML